MAAWKEETNIWAGSKKYTVLKTIFTCLFLADLGKARAVSADTFVIHLTVCLLVELHWQGLAIYAQMIRVQE